MRVHSGAAVLEVTDESGQVCSLRSEQEAPELIAAADDLWAVETAGRRVTAAQARRFDARTDGDGLRLAWELDAPEMAAEVRVRPGGDGTFALTWSARSLGETPLCLEEVHFPRLRASDAVAQLMRSAATFWPEVRVEDLMRTDWDDQAEVAVPVHDAAVDADSYCGGLYPSAWAAVPFFAAWTQTGTALYVGVHDAQAHTKTVLWDHRDVRCTYHVPDPDRPRQTLTVPYPVVLGALPGDWHQAAAIYRDWAHGHAPWCRRGSLTTTAPAWAQDSVAWFYSIGSAGDTSLPLEQLLPRLREVFGIPGPIGVHAIAPQHQEHSNMPDGEPPAWLRRYRERQVRVAAEHGYHLFEYRNAHKYTKDFPGYETAKPHACRWRGRLHEEGPYGGGPDFGSSFAPAGSQGTRTVGEGDDAYGVRPENQMYPLVEMCIGTGYWRDKLLDAVAPCVSYGMVGNYLDQIGSNRNFSRCDHPGHGHPVRGGTWYAEDHVRLIEQVVRHYRLNGVERPILSHEFLTEPLLGLLNTTLVDGDARLLAFLYHDRVILESHETYNGLPDVASLRRALARDVHTGRMPAFDVPCSLPGVDLTAALAGDPAAVAAPALVSIRRWLQTRSAWLEYLNLGRLERAPEQAGGHGGIVQSVWSTSAGGWAVLASNVTDQPVEVTVEPVALPGRAEGPRTWHAWRDDRIDLGPAPQGHRTRLDPDATLVLEAAPA